MCVCNSFGVCVCFISLFLCVVSSYFMINELMRCKHVKNLHLIGKSFNPKWSMLMFNTIR